MSRLGLAIVLTVIFVAPARADVTITAKTSGTGLAQIAEGQNVTFIKGMKMRTDQAVLGQTISTIIDLPGKEMIILHLNTREAEIYDVTKFSGDKELKSVEGMKAQLTPNGKSREILGRTTKGYDLMIAAPLPASVTGPQVSIEMTGQIWIAPDSPGAADYAAFHREAAAKGIFFGAPPQGGSSPQAQALSQMYKAMTQAGGVPYAIDTQMKIKAPPEMAGFLAQIGDLGFSTLVTAVSTETVPDEKFVVPAGWKMTRK